MPRRIAFLTPEYVTNAPTGGGLASYVDRIARVLRTMGHEPEVFTLADTPEVLDHDGVRVEHVVPADNAITKLLGAHWRLRLRFGVTLRQLRGAVALAGALRQREAQKPFDMVQSADWGLSGLFVPRQATRAHLVRCSWSRKACEHAAGLRPNLDNRLLAMLERRCMRRADAVYAPSRFVAESVGRDAGVTIHVVRPPVEFDPHGPARTVAPSTALPPRFLLHFGLLSAVKGTDVLLAALPRAWQQAPDLAVVLAGRESEAGYVERRLKPLGERGRRQVIWTGPLSRDQLAAILPRADAAVLPSRSDNLPNTIIESLAAGVPVVGSDGASIDELVRPGVNGLLVPIEDAATLGDAMAAAWRGELADLRGTDKTARTLEPLRPRNAVAALMRLAGCADDADRSASADCAAQAISCPTDGDHDARQFPPARRPAA